MPAVSARSRKCCVTSPFPRETPSHTAIASACGVDAADFTISRLARKYASSDASMPPRVSTSPCRSSKPKIRSNIGPHSPGRSVTEVRRNSPISKGKIAVQEMPISVAASSASKSAPHAAEQIRAWMPSATNISKIACRTRATFRRGNASRGESLASIRLPANAPPSAAVARRARTG